MLGLPGRPLALGPIRNPPRTTGRQSMISSPGDGRIRPSLSRDEALPQDQKTNFDANMIRSFDWEVGMDRITDIDDPLLDRPRRVAGFSTAGRRSAVSP